MMGMESQNNPWGISFNSTTESNVPTKGALPKRALVRAEPRLRMARMNR